MQTSYPSRKRNLSVTGCPSDPDACLAVFKPIQEALQSYLRSTFEAWPRLQNCAPKEQFTRFAKLTEDVDVDALAELSQWLDDVVGSEARLEGADIAFTSDPGGKLQSETGPLIDSTELFEDPRLGKTIRDATV